MNFSSLNYNDEPLDMFRTMNIGNNITEPVCINNNLIDEPINIREKLLSILNDKDVLQIDDPEF